MDTNFTKVACNATNSAAIDCEGILQVWGSGKYGLLGHGLQSNNYNHPKPLYLTKAANTHGADRDAFMKSGQTTKQKVRDIAMGQYHMLVNTVDAEFHKDWKQLEYANEIFHHIKAYLLQQSKIQESLSPRFLQSDEKLGATTASVDNEIKQMQKRLIEVELEKVFSKDQEMWPFIRWTSFYRFLFEQINLTFTENIGMAIDQLQVDLQSDENPNLISLKELRDLIIGERTNTSRVFGWGLQDERLCAHSTLNQGQGINRYSRPKIIPLNYEEQIVKVVCGNSYSLALTEKGTIYSWGIGKSGSLGLGELSIIERLPKRVIFPDIDKFDENVTSRSHLTNNTPSNPKRQFSGNTQDGVQEGKKVRIRMISSGQSHCLALSESGQVYSWGNGQGGRLGHGDSIGKNLPEMIQSISHLEIVVIECGDAHSSVITATGNVFVWGVGLNGRLGIGVDSNSDIPRIIQEFQINPGQRLFFGMSTSFVLTKANDVFCWGSGLNGKLGLPNSTRSQFFTPRRLYTLNGFNIAQIAAGPFHTLVLTADGRILAFGNVKEGKLGIQHLTQQKALSIEQESSNNDMDIDYPMPLEEPVFYIQKAMKQIFDKFDKFKAYTSIGTLDCNNDASRSLQIVQTCCSDRNSYILLNSGAVYAVGANDKWQCTEMIEKGTKEGQLEILFDEEMLAKQASRENGNYPMLPSSSIQIIMKAQEMQPIKSPLQVSIMHKHVKTEVQIKHLAVGANHVLATSIGGQCYVWGSNEYGQLGLGKLDQIEKATFLKDLQDERLKMCAAGHNHSLFLTELGHVYSSGFNEFGQLGFGSVSMQLNENLQEGMSVEAKSEIVNNFYLVKTKSVPQRIPNLDKIRFIACGASHSLAIQENFNDEKNELKLYSWGWGAYGQLGHAKIKNQFNLHRPKKVKFRDALDTQIAFVAGGTYHTLCLDVRGRLWYFGNKESVGIKSSFEHRMQFQPIQLGPANKNRDFEGSLKQGFVFISANGSLNLALSANDKTLFYFGKQILENIQQSAEETQKNKKWDKNNQTQDENLGSDQGEKQHFTFFERVEEVKGSIMSAGKDHIMMVDNESGIPYAWGDNTFYRFGKQKQKYYDSPKILRRFTEIFESIDDDYRTIAQKIKFQATDITTKSQKTSKIAAKQPNNKEQTLIRPLKFPVQKDIKSMKLDQLKQHILVKQDTQLWNQFKELTTSFSRALRGYNLGIEAQKTLTQDGLITRTLLFPTPLDLHKQIESSVPKSIIRNRQFFEAIFTFLQTHPCYMINWITKTKFFDEPEGIKLLIYAIYGKREIKDNQRLLSTLLIVSREVFKYELNQINFKEMTSIFRTDSAFKTIFNLIFTNQSRNKHFVRQIISSTLLRISEMYDTAMIQGGFDQMSQQKANFRFSGGQYEMLLLHLLNDVRKVLEQLDGIDQWKFASTNSERSVVTLEILSLLSFTFGQLQTKSKEWDQSQFGQQFSNKNTKEKLNDLDNLQEGDKGDENNQQYESTIHPEKETQSNNRHNEELSSQELIRFYILDLLFQNLIETMQNLTIQEIRFEYWDYRMGPDGPPEILNNSHEGKPVLKTLGSYLRIYITNQHFNEVPKQLQSFMRTGRLMQSNNRAQTNGQIDIKEINFRDEIFSQVCESQTYKPINLDLILVSTMFQNSIETQDPQLTVTLADIIYVYNQLVTNSHQILIQDHQNDPLIQLVNELGGHTLSTNIPNETLRARLNFRINCRLLLYHSKIVKCHTCSAPVTEDMIPEYRFKIAFEGQQWMCNKETCRKLNPPMTFSCVGCSKAIPEDIMAKDLVFERFRVTETDPQIVLFYQVLLKMPLIDKNAEFMTVLEQEIQDLEDFKRQNTDLAQNLNSQNILQQFKQNVDSYVIENRVSGIKKFQKFGFSQLDNERKDKLYLLMLQNQYFAMLSDKMLEEIQKKQQHMNILKEYKTVLIKISQMKPLVKQRSVNTIMELDQILHNSYTGLSSDFLKLKLKNMEGMSEKRDPNKFKESVWAGSLHLDPTKEAQKQKETLQDEEALNGLASKKQRITSIADLIQVYFGEITPKKALSVNWDGINQSKSGGKVASGQNQENTIEIGDPLLNADGEAREQEELEQLEKLALAAGSDSKSYNSVDMTVLGSFRFIDLQKAGLIKKVDKLSYDFEILRDSYFFFYDNGRGGFHIELVYKEPPRINIKLQTVKEEVVLESFNITRDILGEMRRNYACHSTIIFGQMQFRVHELVKVLNQVIMKNNIYASLYPNEKVSRLLIQNKNQNVSGATSLAANPNLEGNNLVGDGRSMETEQMSEFGDLTEGEQDESENVENDRPQLIKTGSERQQKKTKSGRKR